MSIEDLANKPQPIADYTGFDLAIGSVFAFRHFRPDDEGRLRAINYPVYWKPGENVAVCHKGESLFSGYSRATRALSFDFTITNSGGTPTFTVTDETQPSLAQQAVESKVKVEHLVPTPSCTCGFYAFAEDCDDGGYSSASTVAGIVECYGRTILGTKGLRCEKARIVALLKPSKQTRELYPDAKVYRSLRWMLRRHDVIQPLRRTPETDPNFWGEA